MRRISVYERLSNERKENEKLRTKNAKFTADIDYIAMMCDVELEEGDDNAQSEVREG